MLSPAISLPVIDGRHVQLARALSESVDVRERRLQGWLTQQESVLLGFSGGVDSTYLAALCSEALPAERFLAVTGRSASYPAAQWTEAVAVARSLGIRHIEIDTAELDDPDYASNPGNRCYYCKRELWAKLQQLAQQHGLQVVIDGTNADDVGGHRPGMLAADERAVVSPLAQFGLRKQEIRDRLRARGLRGWDRPSSPCLASRIPYGTPVTMERLGLIERAEGALRAHGVKGDMRVRLHGSAARVELCASELMQLSDETRLKALASHVRGAGFSQVYVDLRGYSSGSLNRVHSAGPDETEALREAVGRAAAGTCAVTVVDGIALLELSADCALQFTQPRAAQLVLLAEELGFAGIALGVREGGNAGAPAVCGD